MKNALKSTTSLVVSLSLMAPAVVAQETSGDAPTFPCATPAGTEVGDMAALTAALLAEAAGGAAGTSEAPACVIPPDIAAVATETAEPAAPVEEAAPEVVAEEPAPEPDVAEETAAEPVVEVAPVVEEAPAVEQTPVDQAAPVAQTPVVEDPVVEEPVLVEEAAEPAPEAPAVEQTPVAEVEPPVVEEVQTPTAEAAPAEDPVVVEEAATPEPTPAEEPAPAAETPAAEIEATLSADTDVAAQEGEADVAPDTTAETETAPAAVVPEAAPAAAAAADTTTETEAEVVVETVTEEDVRSADEDFATSVSGTQAPSTEEATTATTSPDRGLSTFEKALLLGLGAAVVGSVLSNGDEVVSNSGDRVVVERNGELVVLKNDDALLRQAGSEVSTQTFNDGSTRTTVNRENGEQIVTIRANDGRVLRRARILPDGTEILLFDDTVRPEAVDVAKLPVASPRPVERTALDDQDALRAALTAVLAANTNRAFSLNQVRGIREVRALAPQVELDTITFATGSAAIEPSQAEELGALGQVIRDIIRDNPSAVFLIEGHTDTVGEAGYNLSLSDRRAETVALALTQYFDVPPENLVTQGYGETDLKIATEGDIRENRRAAVRNITSLLSR